MPYSNPLNPATKDFTLFHRITYEGKSYIFDPYNMGIGGWKIFHERSGKPGISVSRELNRILNKLMFDSEELPDMLDRYDLADEQGRQRYKMIATSWLEMKIRGIRPSYNSSDWITTQQNLDAYNFTKSNLEFRPGRMYFYVYDAKWKERLPIWDRFPLTIIIETYFGHESYEDGFLGLNLHYVNEELRADILKELVPKKGILMEHNSILQAQCDYPTLVSMLKLSVIKPCIKRYIFRCVKSRILPISSHEWAYAIWLPVQQFVTKN